MAKARSPGYPSIDLREAVDKVSLVYHKDYQNPIPRMVAVEHMGYKGLSGKSLGVLSSLGKYGLIEGRGEETRVSDLAVRIIAHFPGTLERLEALQEAASLPELFSELDSRFQNGRASDTAIRSYLLTTKFIPGAADTAVATYRKTKAFLMAEEQSAPEPVVQPSAVLDVNNSHHAHEARGTGVIGHTAEVAVVGRSIPKSSSEAEIANIRVAKDCAIRLVADGPYTKRSIEALVKNLELQLALGSYDDVEPQSIT